MKRIACLVLVLTAISSCGSKKAEEKAANEELQNSGPLSHVVGMCKIEPETEIVQLSSPVNGIVQKILKKENDTVSIGTTIVELEHKLEDAKVEQLSGEISTQIFQIRADEASKEEYEAKYNNAVSETKRLLRLLEKGAETQQAVDNANTDLKSYLSNLRRLEAGVAVSKSKLNQMNAALNTARIEREQKFIKSPVNGKILEISTIIGSAIDTRVPFAQINPMGKTIAVCEIDEMYAGKIAVGQKAWIRNVGSMDTLSAGEVYLALSFLKKKSLFSDQSGEKEDRRVRTIKIMLEKPDNILLNARVECVVNIPSGVNN